MPLALLRGDGGLKRQRHKVGRGAGLGIYQAETEAGSCSDMEVAGIRGGRELREPLLPRALRHFV